MTEVPKQRGAAMAEADLDSALELIPAPAWIHAGGTVLYANPAMSRLLGTLDLIGRTVISVVHFDSREVFLPWVRSVLEHGEAPPAELRLETASGDALNVEVSAVRVERQGIPAVLATFTDLTARKKTECSLRELAERYETTLQYTPGMVYTARPDGFNDYISSSFFDYTGMDAAAALGYGWQQALHPDDVRYAEQAWDQANCTGSRVECEFRIRRFDGTYRWFRTIMSPLRDSSGGIVRWVGVCVDIDEQKCYREALALSDRRFRAIFDRTMSGVMIGNRERMLEANDRLLRMLGRTRQQLDAGELTWRAIVPPELLALSARKFDETVAHLETPPFEMEYVRPDGSRAPVMQSAAVLTTDPEAICIGLVLDLTERRRLEALRSEASKLEAIACLAGGMAHNLNNLLTSILGHASLLQGAIPPASELEANVEAIITAGERAAELTAKLSAYAGQKWTFAVPTDLAVILVQTIRKLQGQVPPNLHLTLETPASAPPVLVDPDHVQLIIKELIQNAAEAIGQNAGGEVRICLHSEYLPRQTGDFLSGGEYVVIDVRDNGPGMDADTLAKIFDPFFSTRFTGRGLGLAAINGMMRACGGSVRVSSTIGSGSTFRLYFPCSR